MKSNNQPEDQSLRDALLGVSAPAGLRQRLLSRLREEAVAYDGLPQLGNQQEEPVGGCVELPREIVLSDRGKVRRRKWISLTLAVTLVGLAFGVFQWSRPPSTEQLAQFTLGQLDRLLSEDAVWQTDFEKQFPELGVLAGKLRLNVEPLGYQDIAGGVFAEQCRVWKLNSQGNNKAFYVFDFRHARQIPALNEQLQAIKRASGGWSSVAMRSGNRLVVVLVEGTLDNYLYQSQSA